MRLALLFLVAFVGSGRLPANASTLESKELVSARKLALRKCTKCHKFYEPASYPRGEWDQWMDRMTRKSKLTALQEKQIRSYLDTLRPKP